ncbi:MAG: hypothetical protein J6W37_07565 [Bacteroidales bacterium]|nr:hypothetical protein [Bacteroidales bacterium]
MKRFFTYGFLLCLLISMGGIGNIAFAVTVNNSTGLNSVSPTDDVTLQGSNGTIFTLSSDLTCKSINLNTYQGRIDLNGHTLTVTGNLTLSQSETSITNGGSIVVGGNLELNAYKAKIDISGSLTVTGNVTLPQNGNLIKASSVSATGNVTLSGYESQIKTDNFHCQGNLDMSETNTKIDGPANVEGNISISGYSAGIQGSVDCGGNLSITSSQAYISGDVSVVGDLNMTGYQSSISGSASVGGNSNINENATIQGGISEYQAPAEPISVTLSGSQCGGTLSAITSESDVTYQWYNRNGIALTGSGVNESTFQPLDEGDYYCIVTKNDRTGTTNALTYYGQPKIIETSAASLEFLNGVNGTPSTKRLTVTTVCDEDNTNVVPSISGNDASKFSVEKNENEYIITFNETTAENTYNAVLTLTCGSQNVNVSLIGTTATYPATYIIKKNGVDYPLTTDNNGDIVLEMEADGNNKYVIPNNVRINCRNFTVKTANNITDHCTSSFINQGSIQASGDIHLTASGRGSVLFDCNGVYVANNLGFSGYIAYDNTSAFKGSFKITNKFYTESNGQGQDLYINECAYITAYEGNFSHSGGSMIMYIDGELVVERFIQNNTVHVRDGGMFIVGEVEISASLSILGYKGSVISLCYNPTLNGTDDLGFCAGTVFYNDNPNDHGWAPSNNPLGEGDINESLVASNSHSTAYWNAVNNSLIGTNGTLTPTLTPAFHSYNECLDPAETAALLGIKDDPFLPKNKEIKKLYIDNPCSEEYESHKIQLRELGGKWFRVINGELIYCENDNK